MELEHVTPILNVSNVPQSIAWFEKLGWKRSFTWNSVGMIEGARDADEDGEADYGGVVSGCVEIFLCKDAQGSRGNEKAFIPGQRSDDTGGALMTWWLPSPTAVETVYARAMSLGSAIVMPLTNQPWNAIEFRIRHPDGHTFRISAFLEPR